MKDPLTHARKTLMGDDFSYGKTVATWCGKRRIRDLTPVGPEGVTCTRCRITAANMELDLSKIADLAAGIGCPDHLGRSEPGCRACEAQDAQFANLAEQHRAAARVWDPHITL
jgi:hypothetical protein